MRKLSAFESITLDGVMQAPAAEDEDPTGGFPYGGWANRYFDPAMLEASGVSAMSGQGSLLLGRRTYEHFATVWPHMPDDNPFTRVMNESEKLVVSRTLRDPLGWTNARVVEGGVPDGIAEMKAGDGSDVVILGSGELVRSLMEHGLIDEFVLQIHPLVLGQGKRLFEPGTTLADMELVKSVPTPKGVVINTYRRSE